MATRVSSTSEPILPPSLCDQEEQEEQAEPKNNGISYDLARLRQPHISVSSPPVLVRSTAGTPS